jgi:aconitase B
LTHRVPPLVDEAAYIKVNFLVTIASILTLMRGEGIMVQQLWLLLCQSEKK